LSWLVQRGGRLLAEGRTVGQGPELWLRKIRDSRGGAAYKMLWYWAERCHMSRVMRCHNHITRSDDTRFPYRPRRRRRRPMAGSTRVGCCESMRRESPVHPASVLLGQASWCDAAEAAQLLRIPWFHTVCCGSRARRGRPSRATAAMVRCTAATQRLQETAGAPQNSPGSPARSYRSDSSDSSDTRVSPLALIALIAFIALRDLRALRVDTALCKPLRAWVEALAR
jgi:hypothetical protein